MEDFDIMSALDDEPRTLDLTIDHNAIPTLVAETAPDDWPDLGLSRAAFDFSHEREGDFWTNLSGSMTSTGDILVDKVEEMIARAKALSDSLNPIEKY